MDPAGIFGKAARSALLPDLAAFGELMDDLPDPLPSLWRRLVEHILKDHSQGPMGATTFDTLEISKRLKEAGLPEAQAEAVTAAIRTARDATDLSHLVTKADLKAYLAELKAELRKWFVGIAFAQSALIVTLLKLFPGR